MSFKIGALIPDRGDRPSFTKLCLYMIERQTYKFDEVAHVNYKPKSDQVDILDRLLYGVEELRSKGVDFVYVIENDDYYPPNYVASSLPGWRFESLVDFVGYPQTIYYHIHSAKGKILTHNNHSSLFCTGFKIDALDRINWPKKNSPFIDVAIWRYAIRSRKKIRWVRDCQPIGIKHGIGLCGGSGHRSGLKWPHDGRHIIKKYVHEKELQEFYLRYHVRRSH